MWSADTNAQPTTAALPSLAVAICTSGQKQDIARCLGSLRAQSVSPDEIVVVWSGYDSPPADCAFDTDIRSVCVPRPGLSIARNAALNAARSDIVAFLDDDALADPEWCNALRRTFVDKSIAAASGPLLPLQGESSGHVHPAVPYTLLESERTVNRDDRDWFALIHFGGFVGGSNMAVRRGVVSGNDLFHPDLGRGGRIDGGEEQYAFHQLIEQGHKVRYDPRAIVRHPIPVTDEEIAREAYRRQRAGVSYLGFLFFENATARSALPRWLLRRGSRRSRSFAVLRNRGRLALRSRLDGLADFMKLMLGMR